MFNFFSETFTDLALGYLAADFVMGVYHWVKDTYFYPLDPVIGENFIWGSRLHHIDQTHFTKNSDANIIKDSTIWTLPLALPCFFLFGVTPFTISMFSFVCINDVIHKYMHTDDIPWWAIKMQNCGIFQTKIDHDKHHQFPHIVYYCPISPYLNPILESINFWRGLENIVKSLLKIEPREKKNEYVIDDKYPGGIKFI